MDGPRKEISSSRVKQRIRGGSLINYRNVRDIVALSGWVSVIPLHFCVFLECVFDEYWIPWGKFSLRYESEEHFKSHLITLVTGIANHLTASEGLLFWTKITKAWCFLLQVRESLLQSKYLILFPVVWFSVKHGQRGTGKEQSLHLMINPADQPLLQWFFFRFIYFINCQHNKMSQLFLGPWLIQHALQGENIASVNYHLNSYWNFQRGS